MSTMRRFPTSSNAKPNGSGYGMVLNRDAWAGAAPGGVWSTRERRSSRVAGVGSGAEPGVPGRADVDGVHEVAGRVDHDRLALFGEGFARGLFRLARVVGEVERVNLRFGPTQPA